LKEIGFLSLFSSFLFFLGQNEMIKLKPNLWLSSNNYKNKSISILAVLSLILQLLASSTFNFTSLSHVSTSQVNTEPKPSSIKTTNSQSQASSVAQNYAKQPLSFEVNQGQVDDQVNFVSRGSGYSFFLTSNEAVFSLSKPKQNNEQDTKYSFLDTVKNKDLAKRTQVQSEPPEVVKMSFIGANPNPQVVGEEEQLGKSNYFIGNDPSKWKTNVSHYSRVRYKDIYQGIDVVYYGNDLGQLEYDFNLAPGVDPHVIKLNFEGVDRLETTEKGDLVLHLSSGDLVQKAPRIFQEINSVKRDIVGNYQVSNLNLTQVSFVIKNFDKTLPVTIDPSLLYSTYLGGGPGDDVSNGIAVDSSGDAFVTGMTGSINFPIQNAFQPNPGGGGDAFVTKFNVNGTLAYSTYLGGSGNDNGTGIAVDGSGNAFVTGATSSINFPIQNAFQPKYGGGNTDAFVTKFNVNGTLAYSTYLGGNLGDQSFGIAVNINGNAFVTGITGSINFPIQNAFQPNPGGGGDAFVTKFNINGTLAYSTFLGGNNTENSTGIAVDGSGNAFVTGQTLSLNFPIQNAFQPNYGGGTDDAFVTKLNANGTLAYSTYLGGSDNDTGTGIAVDESGNAFVTGATSSINFPIQNAFQPNPGGGGDAFVTKFNVNGTLAYSTYLGGSGDDTGTGIAVDGNGNAFVTGYTRSYDDFPNQNAFQPNYGGGYNDAFVTKFNANETLAYSSFLGGSDRDQGTGIAVDSSGNSFVTGITYSSNFPIQNAFQPNPGGGGDAFVSKISPIKPAPIPPAPGPSFSQSAGGGSNSQLLYPETQSCTCLPINTATGNFYHTFDDLSISGRGFQLAFSHTYNSQFNTVNGLLGYGWTFNYNMWLSQDQNNEAVTISEEGGSQLIFTLSNGSFQPPAFTQATLVKNGDGSFTFTRLNRQIFTFSAAGKLIQQKDLNGYATNLSYNGNGQLATITDPASRTLTLAYSGTHLISLTDPANRQILFSYDGSGNLANFTDVGGGVTNFSYDANHLLLTMQDPRGGVITNHYDGQGKVDWQTDQLGRKTTLAYSADGTTITDPKGNITFEQYINNVRVASTKGYGTAQAATTTFTYDPATMGVATVTDPNGNVTSYTYDSQGNVLTVKDSLNRQTTNTYDAFNDLLTTTDPKGITTTFTYDNKGNLLSQSRPLNGNTNQVITYHYADGSHPGDVTSMTDPDGKNWTYSYDTYGNKTTIIDPLNHITTFTYNNLGWKTSQISPKGNAVGGNPAQFTTTFGYDAFGMPTTNTDPLGHTITKHYDPDHNLEKLTDAKGATTNYTYDAANELTIVTRPDGSTQKTDYNPDGSVAKQYDGKNQATVYTYDPLGQLSSQTDPLGHTTGFTYDSSGNRLSMTDAQNKITSYSYDAANELQSISYSDGVTPDVTNITYDANGNRTGMNDGTGTSSWTYDQLNRLISSTNGGGQTIGYSYDLKGQLTGLTYPGNKAVSRRFDDAGRLIFISDWMGNTTNLGYDVNSNLTTETLPAASGVVDSYSFDQADRLMGINYAKSGTNFASFTYTRNENNSITGDTPTGVVQPAKTYTYNSLNQLQGANDANFTYDKADNIIGKSGLTFNYNAANQLTSLSKGAVTTASFSFDYKGNRITMIPTGGQANNYTYDQANRLTGFGSIASYKYNGDGLRTSKTVNGTTTNFVWDEAESLPLLLIEAQTSYIYDPDGLPLEQITASGTIYYYHHDQLGSTRLITDNSGTVVATYTYDEWGNLRVKTGKIVFQPNGHFTAQAGGVTNQFGFAGQYTDNESGFIYLRARLYDPSTSQFLNRDPAINLTKEPYNYVGNNPINLIDPSGLIDWKKLGTSVVNNALPFLGGAGLIIGGALAIGSGGLLPVAGGVVLVGVGLYKEYSAVNNVRNASNGSNINMNSHISGAILENKGFCKNSPAVKGADVMEDFILFTITGGSPVGFIGLTKDSFELGESLNR
jgi:RHS repeat-associated protein